MFVRVWQFRVSPERTDEFREVYGPTGEWARLFRRETAFLGTELLQSSAHPDIFLTIDRWDSAAAWAAFLRAWGEEYAELDQRCGALTVAEGEIGTFEATPEGLGESFRESELERPAGARGERSKPRYQ